MKLSNIKLAIAASTLLLASGAYAVDGKINFTGEIVDSACSAQVNGSSNGSVALGRVSASALNGDTNKVAGATPFTIAITGCPNSTNIAVKFDATPDQTNSKLIAISSESNVATGVALGIFNTGEADPIPLFSASKTVATSDTGAANLSFSAKYVSTAKKVEAGGANASATFSIVYP